ncbi:MAG: type II toxin-antitoxin system Phd/YefM family antitoxin [Candidatus Methanoplasma sp.]|jgi:prevent-host-death family protein|nr:type II toxin-antitoxin system Phd/YefM family antitoxin [Candidatus Methanoplasma sp.]
MTTINATEARADLYNVIAKALDEPIRITSKRGTVVMVSEEEWENILETIYLMGVPGLKEDIEEGRRLPKDRLVRWKSSDI